MTVAITLKSFAPRWAIRLIRTARRELAEHRQFSGYYSAAPESGDPRAIAVATKGVDALLVVVAFNRAELVELQAEKPE